MTVEACIIAVDTALQLIAPLKIPVSSKEFVSYALRYFPEETPESLMAAVVELKNKNKLTTIVD